MRGLLARAAARFYSRHPWQLALAIAGISLGVAVYVGVELANDSARRAFELSAAALRGATTHRLLPVGGDLDENVYVEVVIERGLSRAAPVIELTVGAAGRGRTVMLLGIDPLEEMTFRGFASFVPGSGADVTRLLTEPGTVLLPETLHDELAPLADGTLELSIGGTRRRVVVAGVLRTAAFDAGVEPPIVTDIATAQDLTGRYGLLSHIDLQLTAPEAEELAAAPPAGTTLVPAGSDTAAFDELTAAFRTNLTALGLLALVVGVFLIYATMSFAIVQRRATLATLLAIGTARRQLFAGVLAEAAVLGGLATLIGLALGHWLAIGLVDLMLRTIGDLYFTSTVRAAAPSPLIFVQGAVVGVAATLAAAVKPAADAARVAPSVAMRRSDLERRSRRGVRRAAWLALPLAGAGAAAIAFGPPDLMTAFAGLFCILAAGALLTPGTTVLLMRGAERPAGGVLGIAGTLAVRGVSGSLSRTGVASAALAVAVATVIGVGLMIGSFRASVADWLNTTLTADLYITFARAPERGAFELSRLAALPGVRGLSTTRAVRLTTDLGEVTLRAVEPGPRGWGLAMVDSGDAALERLGRGEGIAVAEPFAYRREISAGGSLTLPTPAGPRAFEVVGVFRDYNAGGHSIVMESGLYRRHWHDDALSGIGLDVAAGVSTAEIERSLARALPAEIPFRVRSSAGLEELSLAIFDRTFRITEVLRVLAATVAFLGLLSALLSIELERARELAVLRSLGFAPGQLGALVMTQTGLLGAAAGLAAVPLGAVLAALLVHVINRRSFGWSMDFSLTAAPVLAGVAVAIGAALLAGVYPAWRLGRSELGRALREE